MNQPDSQTSTTAGYIPLQKKLLNVIKLFFIDIIQLTTVIMRQYLHRKLCQCSAKRKSQTVSFISDIINTPI